MLQTRDRALKTGNRQRAFQQERQMFRQCTGLVGAIGQQLGKLAGEQGLDLLLVSTYDYRP